MPYISLCFFVIAKLVQMFLDVTILRNEDISIVRFSTSPRFEILNNKENKCIIIMDNILLFLYFHFQDYCKI